MDFKSDMQARIQEIEAALQTYIPKQEAFPPVIFEAMGYSLFAGGKRLRPMMVLAACEMRDEGKDAASIAQAMQDLIGRVNVSFVIDTLEYMWKGGRCTGVTAFGANLLNLKPCIEMRNGKLEVCKKYRGNIEKVYEKYIAERLKGKKVDPRYIFITTSNAPTPELAARLESAVRKAVPEAQEIFFTRTGCTVTSHCGPGTMGVLFLEA